MTCDEFAHKLEQIYRDAGGKLTRAQFIKKAAQVHEKCESESLRLADELADAIRDHGTGMRDWFAVRSAWDAYERSRGRKGR